MFSGPDERARKAKETTDRYDFTCLTVEEVARSYQVGYIYLYINKSYKRIYVCIHMCDFTSQTVEEMAGSYQGCFVSWLGCVCVGLWMWCG